MTPILALDLGKFKTMVCCFDPARPDAAQFRTIATGVVSFERLLMDEQPEFVVFETCTIAGWVSDLCTRLGIDHAVANPNGEAWRWRNVKRKTDRDDALKLARLAAADELPVAPMPPPGMRQERQLQRHRDRLVSDRVATQNNLRALTEAQGLRMPTGAKAWSKQGLAVLDEWSKPLAECGVEELWRGVLHEELQKYRSLLERESAVDAKLEERAATNPAVIRLRTIPGVGRCTAEVVANYLYDPARFDRAGEVSAYAGLVPRQYQSGEQDRRGRISKCGPRRLRRALVEAAWCLLRYNAWGARLFARLTKGQKTRRKAAIVAVARKLLIRCWGMLRKETDWAEPPTVAA